ncbi:hypothetical protein BGZ80_005180 [Entomortierella chlamydospora]|uniref:Uncharacterized protein n=1 Tax=Entomortierella chlamydospora TaxID=101097 RepID=A0A9P6N103_9FUNG|nr:hypothetical protein BGZ80_005180 [Entomortierella chlamydospora]
MSSLGGFAQFATPAFSASSSYVASTAPRSTPPNRSGTSSPALTSSGSSSAFGGHDADVVNVISNGELSMIIKRLMSKRDTTTKVRALEDLEKWVKAQPEDEESGSDACQEAIGPWIKLYIKLTTDVDRRVRLLANNVHMLLVRRVKRKLAPYLKEVIGAWIGTFFDPTRDVARVATEAFKSAFPDNKREQVISFCLQDMIYYVSEILLNKTAETLSDPRFNTKEEMETRYARVASSSLYTIGYIIESLEKGSSDIGQLLDEPKLWQFFGHSNPLVRRASFNMLRTITLKSPNLITERLDIVSKHFFPSAFSDKDTTTHGDLWDALLIFTKAFPGSWTIVAEKKPTMSLFFGFLKAAGYGSATVTYRSILPLIASWGDESVLGKNGTGFPFVKDFFEYFWKGLESPNIEKETGSTALFIEAYVECIVYFIVRFGKSESTKPGQDAAFSAFIKLVTTFLTLSDSSKSTAKLAQDEQGIAKKISHHLVRLLTIPSVRERTITDLWQPTSDAIIELVSSNPTDDYVQRGRRVVLLLSGVATIAREKQDNVISELAEKTADQLVQVVAKQCTGTQSIGPSQLLSSLAVYFEVAVFTNPASQKAMHDFFNLQFADMLLTSDEQKSSDGAVASGSAESLPHLLDLFAGYLCNTKEQEVASQIWKRVMDKVLEETEVEHDRERQKIILLGLFQRMSAAPLTFDMNLDSVNDFVTNVVVDQQYKGSTSGEQLITAALHSKYGIPDKLKLEILDTLSQRLDLFVSDVMGGQAMGKSEEASSVLAITLGSLDHVVPLSIENNADGPLKQIIIAVFDISLQSVEHLSEVCQKHLDELQRLSEGSEDIAFLLKETLTEHIQDNIQHLQRFTSPEDLANQVLKLSDMLNLTELSDRFELLSAFFFDQDHWNSLSKNLSSRGPHPSLAIVDPIVEAYFAENPTRTLATNEPLPVIRYDSFGLSAYGRLALFTFELLKKEDVTLSLFLSYPEKMTWILAELLKVRQGCLDALQTPSSDIGIFYSPDLHADANAVVFRTLLRELGAMATTWITLVLEESWESQIIEALSSSPQTKDSEDDTESGCSATHFALMAIKERDGFSERILADVVQALTQSDTSDVSPANAKAWCQLLKSETLPLSISTGLIIALRKRLENTNEFTNLLNQWVTTPVKPSEVTIQNSEVTRRFTLLVAALGSSEDTAINLPQLRAMNLLQSARRWISDSEALQSFDDQNQLLMHSLLLRLLNSLAYQVQELPGAHWEMMFGFIFSIFKGLGESGNDPFVMLALERTCRLTVSLIELGQEEADILSAWEEHSEGILVSAMRLIGREESRPSMASLSMDRPVRQYFGALSQVCSHAPDNVVLSHGSISEQCGLLMEPLAATQLLAFKQLQTILIEQVQTLSIQMEIKNPVSAAMDQEEGQDSGDNDNSASGDQMTELKFPDSLWRIISNPPKGFPAMDVDVDADDETNLREEFSLLSSSHTLDEEEEDEFGVGAGVAAKSEKIVSHTVLGYLLAWKLAFVIFENTTYTVKSRLVEQLRNSSSMNELLPYLFHLLGIHSASPLVNESNSSGNQTASSSSSELKSMEPFDLSLWDITDYQVTGFSMSSPEIGFPLLAGYLYYTCLANVPSLVRIWWTECKLRQLSIAVESLTEKYFSPLLITRELTSLAKAQQAPAAGSQAAAVAALSGVSDDLNELQIKTSKATSEVTASFQIDEATMEIVIRLPSNFPLRQVEVEGLQRVGVKEARWRAWLLGVAGVIAAQNGSLIDALTLFRKNVGLHFEGVEDCTICYSIVSLQDRSLPNKTFAIDFGTTFSGCAYAYAPEDKEAKSITTWPKQNVQYAKTPTLNLYQEVNGKYKMVEWGWKSKLQMESPAASKYVQLQQYKPRLDENLVLTPWNNKVSVPDAISDYLRAFHEYVADRILQEFGRSHSRKSFRYCLTVPAMWSDKAKDVMRKAAIRAGLITAADHPDRLMLVSEPEAAALYCEKACKQYDLGHGDRFMICDAGGGTVDLIVYEIAMTAQGRHLSEVTKGHGASCGSMFIDLNLGNLLIEKFKRQGAVFPKSVIQTLVETFAYQLKPQFDGEEDMYLALPRNDCFDDLRDPSSIGIDGGYMCLKASELKKVVFEPVVKQVLALIQEQLKGAKSCSAIFMVGGFGSSSYLLDRAKKEFGGRVKTISAPYKPEMAVVCGAVYVGLSPKTVAARVTRRCYGINIMEPFVDGVDPISSWYMGSDGIWCNTRFGTFVRKGQKVEVDECVTKPYVFTKEITTTGNCSIDIYAVDGNPTRYVTSPGVSKLGTIKVSNPFKSSDPIGHKVNVTVKMYFGLSEIKAEAFILGKKYFTTLKFDDGDSC